jgi:endonuclease/exonuclease/phosphatase family metal-dependent hydrolase
MRIVTFNLWGDRAPLDARLDSAAEGLAALAPDIVLLQEVRRGEGLECTGCSLAKRLGAAWRCEFGLATTGPAGTWGPGSPAGEEGVAVLSPHPISDARVAELPEARPVDRRVLLSARVNVGGVEVAVHTTHLHWRLGDGMARERQVVAADELARAFATGVVHVVGGDFNSAPENDEIRFMTGACTLADRRTAWQDAWARGLRGTAEQGWTWAVRNPNTEWIRHLALDRRIDYLFVSPEERSGRGRVLDARVVLDAPGANGVWPSDHFGVLADVQIG